MYQDDGVGMGEGGNNKMVGVTPDVGSIGEVLTGDGGGVTTDDGVWRGLFISLVCEATLNSEKFESNTRLFTEWHVCRFSTNLGGLDEYKGILLNMVFVMSHNHSRT